MFASGGDDIRCRAIAAAAATFRDSAPGSRGIVTCSSDALQDLGRQSLALGAEADRRRAAERLDRLAAVSDQRRPRLRGVGDPGAQQRLSEDGAHARPHRAGSEGVSAAGAEHHDAADQRGRRSDHGADVPRVGDAVQVDAGGGRRVLAPALRARPRSPACRSRARRRRRAGPARPRCRPRPSPAAVSSSTGSAPAARAAASRSSPSVTNSPSASRERRRASRRTSFSFSFCGLVIIGHPEMKRAAALRTARGKRDGALAQAAAPSRASSTNRRKPSGSLTAISASILRFTSTPASLRPWMNSE